MCVIAGMELVLSRYERLGAQLDPQLDHPRGFIYNNMREADDNLWKEADCQVD